MNDLKQAVLNVLTRQQRPSERAGNSPNEPVLSEAGQCPSIFDRLG